MKQWRRNGWLIGGLLMAASSMGCSSEPSCEDLATCVSPPGSSGSSGNTGGSGSSSGGMPDVEDCTNGADDDNDGDTDCADSECSDKYTCVPPIPAGFTDIVMISVKPYGETPAACAGGATPTLFYQNPAVGGCDACTCDVSGVQCIPAPLFTAGFFDMACGQLQAQPAIGPGECRQAVGGSAIVQMAPTMSGACTATATGGPLTPPMETTIATCSLGGSDGRGCGMSGTCVPSDGLSTAEHLCIKKVGHEVCPGDWPLALYAYESFTDDRTGCTECSCTTTCDGGKYTIFPNDLTCAAGGIAVDPVGTCVQNGGAFQMGISMSALTASCTTTGGTSMGSVTPMTETTFCCF